MKNWRIMLIVLGALAVGAIVSMSATAQPDAGAPSIAGNYVLEYRELPDGKQIRPPQVQGMFSLTADRRNFNVYWEQDGKPVSVSIISTYKLSPTEFTEDCSYFMANDGTSGKPPMYETMPKSGKSAVKIDGGKIEIQFPLHGEPKCVFDKSGMTATREGDFVDHWKKVE